MELLEDKKKTPTPTKDPLPLSGKDVYNQNKTLTSGKSQAINNKVQQFSSTPNQSVSTTSTVTSTSTQPYTGNNGKGSAQDMANNDAKLRSDSTYRASEIARANEVIANRRAQGLDTSVQESYLQKIMGYETQGGGSAQQGADPLAELMKMIQGQSSAYYNTQKSMLDANLASNLAEIKKAYDDAVANGQISMRDAETAFAEQKKMIEDESYRQAQQTQLFGQNRGIQNSQQMVGLMQGDNARANSMNNENMTERNRRISDIKDRLSAITKAKDLDIANTNAQYNAGLLGARGQADMMANQQKFQLGLSDYERDENYKNQVGLMGMQNQFDLNKMRIGQGYQQDNMKLNTQLQEGLMKFGHDLDLAKMKVGHSYDMSKLGAQFQHDFDMFAKEMGFKKELQTQQINAEMDKIKKQMEAEEKAYQQELNKYKPGTPEHTALQQQADFEMKNKLQYAYRESIFNSTIQSALNSDIPEMPKPPNQNIWSKKVYQDKYNKYLTDMSAYQNAINRRNSILNGSYNFDSLFNSGSGNFPSSFQFK